MFLILKIVKYSDLYYSHPLSKNGYKNNTSISSFELKRAKIEVNNFTFFVIRFGGDIMLDKISKQVLQYILNCPNCTFSTNHGFPEHIPVHEMISAIDFLEKEGYLTTRRVPSGALISATLTHKGKHPKEFNAIGIKRYLLDKWVDILALVISILAFIGAYRHEISAVLQLLGKALTK